MDERMRLAQALSPATMNPNLAAQGAKYRANMTPPDSVMDPRYPAWKQAQEQASQFDLLTSLPGPGELLTAGKALAGALKGSPALAIFAGMGAKTANSEKLAEAIALQRNGVPREQIWRDTGWFQGPEGKWKFEIDDSGSVPLQRTWGEKADLEQGNSTTTRRQSALAHPELSAAYPETKNIPVRLIPGAGVGGSFETGGVFGPLITSRADVNYGGKADRSTMLHELQHAVQDREGFARGGAPEQFKVQNMQGMHEPYLFESAQFLADRAAKLGMSPAEFAKTSRRWVGKETEIALADLLRKSPEKFMQAREQSLMAHDPKEAYMSLAGEAEARAVQSRMNMTPAERQATPPWQSYDMPWDRLIVR